MNLLLQMGVFEEFMTHQGQPWGWPDTLSVTFAGFLIVFIVLLLLIIIFTVFGKVMQKANEKKQAQQPAKPVAKTLPTGDGEVDDETAAVIVAAITEASGGKQVVIKDIKEASK